MFQLNLSGGIQKLFISDQLDKNIRMGNEASLPLEMCANFDADEIKRLGKRQE